MRKSKGNETDYKWIDVERENRTTENPIYWLEGLVIIIGIVFAMCAFALSV